MAETVLSRNTSPIHLFVTGILLLPAYLFMPVLPIRIIQVACFAVLARVAGKRLKWTYFLLMVASITFFHTLNPFGEVLLEVGPYAVTRGALRDGLFRGLTIVGLVFISLFTVRPELRLPGRLGGLVGRVFYYYERILQGKKRIRPRALIESVDEILEELYLPGSPLPGSSEEEPVPASARAADSTQSVGAAANTTPADKTPENQSAKPADVAPLPSATSRTTLWGWLFIVVLLGVNWALAVVPIQWELF